ncbi:hypothetical protein ACJA3J_15920 [Halobacillus sp. SY10]|uniref:Uncharacterized protein n=1 Tax=Halobacillus aidingensis TaxID=240303 RepID=A0A1H0DZL0_HALAD|nr:hypothetical protein [Halobacillus aidingensis]SDN75580.1 hypothetical protein SAMN05421677_10152 [Halobacillus aidingensis]
MKKRIIIGLISGTVLIWSSVLAVFFLTSNAKVLDSKEHGFTRSIHTEGKSLNDQISADFFERNIEVDNEVRTIIGEKTLTKDWVNDVREDGKLSIDTLLESLELNDTDNS